MVQTIHEIEEGLAETRSALGGSLHDLESKVKSAADWNTHFRASPELWLAVAVGAGLLAGSLTVRRSPARPTSPSPRTAAAWDQAKSDLVAIGTSMGLDFLRDLFTRRER